MPRSPQEKRARDLNRLRQLIAVEEGHRRYNSTGEATAAATVLQEIVTRLKASEEGFTDEELDRLRREAGLDPERREMVRVVIPPSDYDAPEVGERVLWAEELCIAVAESLFCVCLCSVRDNYLWIVGKATDVEIAAGLFRRLARTGLYLLEQDRPKKPLDSRAELEANLERIVGAFLEGKVWSPTDPKTFAKSYLIGYSTMIARRLAAKRAELELTLEGASTALVKAQALVKQYAEEETGGEYAEPNLHGKLDETALKIGMRRGATVNLEGGELPAAREELE